MAQGLLTGKYKPGQPVPAGSRATDAKGGADFISRWLDDDVLAGVKLDAGTLAAIDAAISGLAERDPRKTVGHNRP